MKMELLEYYDKIQRFSLNQIVTYGKVVSVYDGDTFDLSFYIPIQELTKERQISKKNKGICFVCNSQQDSCILMRMKCRLEGLDARELKSEGGQKAKEILESLILQKVLRVQIGNYDKYGRLLVTIFCLNESGSEFCINEYLKSFREYFIFYDGGKKTNSFDEI
jgi:endonuclease YncB( thermonuclease family)